MDTEKYKICPHCGEQILAVAKKCRYCQTWLESDKEYSDSKEKVESDNRQEPYNADVGCGIPEIAVAFICIIAIFLTLVDGAQSLNELIFDNRVMDMRNVHGFWLSTTAFMLKLLCWFPSWLDILLLCVVQAILLYALRTKLINSGISSPGKGLMKTLIVMTLLISPFLAVLSSDPNANEELPGLISLLVLLMVICLTVITVIVAVKLIKIPNFDVSKLGCWLIVVNVMSFLSAITTGAIKSR